MPKAVYEIPMLRTHGKVEDLTKGGACPGHLDDDFPDGTPFGDVTCS